MGESNLADFPEGRPVRSPPTGSPRNGNGGQLINHRLTDLERRMGVVESEIKNLTKVCVQINTKMDSLANKSMVAWVFGGVAVISVATIITHAILRFLSP